MTLISNIINQDYIIIASDKRRTVIENNNSFTAYDDANKLLLGNNYAIGVQGSLQTKNNKYLEKITNLVHQNNVINPIDFIGKIFDIFPKIEEDELCLNLNLTLSGFYEKHLFSYYLDIKNKTIVNCLEEDKISIRANNENDNTLEEAVLIRHLLIFIKRNLNERGKYERFTELNFSNYSFSDLITSLIFAYNRFNENDERFKEIGGNMEYAVFSKDTIIETNLNL
jgi:hypothetical protein